MAADLTGNLILSAEAAALEATSLAAHTQLAQRLLGVDPDVYDGLDATEQGIWIQMCALQVNFQMTLPDAEAYVHHGVSGHQETFGNDRRDLVSPAARGLRDLYFGDGDATGTFLLGGFLTEEEEDGS